jgi:hypothetical protein
MAETAQSASGTGEETMSHLGLGVMINMLSGDEESEPTVAGALGKVIRTIVLDEKVTEDGALVLTFTDGSVLCLLDAGRSCCESRYLTTDDDLPSFAGATFTGLEVLSGPDNEDDDYGVHETAFLHVRTDRGTIVVTTHNEHNGYYGGFWLIARVPNEDGTVSRW